MTTEEHFKALEEMDRRILERHKLLGKQLKLSLPCNAKPRPK